MFCPSSRLIRTRMTTPIGMSFAAVWIGVVTVCLSGCGQREMTDADRQAIHAGAEETIVEMTGKRRMSENQKKQIETRVRRSATQLADGAPAEK